MKSSLIRIACPCITAVCLLLTSCARKADRTAVPKPEAWPRIEVPAKNYATLHFSDTEISFNTEATVTSERKDDGWWINVDYPQFRDCRLYLTLTDVAPGMMDGIIDKRHERMSLNAGGATTTLTQLTSAGGWACELAETHNSMTTPLQVLASDSGKVLSGAFYLNLPADASPDSIAPAVKAVRDDLLTLLKTLS